MHWLGKGLGVNWERNIQLIDGEDRQGVSVGGQKDLAGRHDGDADALELNVIDAAVLMRWAGGEG